MNPQIYIAAMRPRPILVLLLALSGAAGGCFRPVTNYVGQPGPRYVAEPAAAAPAADDADLKVVTWNLKWGREPRKAGRALARHPALRDADLIVMQEMDESAVAAVAGELGFGYVYYPATLHPQTRRHFGNAILSPWPLVEDRKLPLPGVGRFVSTRRVAVVATALIGERRIRVYGVHLATPFEIGPQGIQEQLRTVIRDAEQSRDPVVIAGDLNSTTVGGLLLERGYQWLTRYVGPTAWTLPIDHVFLRAPAATFLASGAVDDASFPSDHRPVWALVRLDPLAGSVPPAATSP